MLKAIVIIVAYILFVKLMVNFVNLNNRYDQKQIDMMIEANKVKNLRNER